MRQPGKWQQRVQSLFNLERRKAIVLCTALFVAIAIADVVTPPQLNLTFAYVFVILLASWNICTTAAVVYALAAFAMQVVVLSEPGAPDLQTIYWYITLGNRLFTFLIVVVLTVPLRVMYRSELETARVDSLTGAISRRHFMQLLAMEIARSKRTREPFSVGYLDCDNFKSVNDTHGHGAGDILLRTAVDTLRQNLRVIDIVARIGGDEFVVLMPSTGGGEAAPTMERVRADLNRVMAANGWQASFSIGLGTFDGSELSPDDVVARCDALMYRAKAEGKNRIVRE